MKDKRKVWLDKQEKSGRTTLPIYAYLDKELYDALRQFAFDRQESKGEVVRLALREYLAKHKKGEKGEGKKNQ